ncbi:MAG: hypothetical protein SWJ54_25065 [Cyanobacteriota bacterium]|nr:hypothetical protein [Cyanobacteriota bacterium]
MLIFPVLREVYRLHRDRLMLWSHKPIFYSTQLSGIPDYIVAQRSPLGKEVFDRPYLIAVEANKVAVGSVRLELSRKILR